MLNAFRSKTGTRIAGILLFLVLIALVITGFGTGGFGGLGSVTKNLGGSSADTLATVDGTAVTASELHSLVTNQFQRARQQQPTLDMATFLQSGAYDQLLDAEINATAVQAFAQRQGIAVSDNMVDTQIANIPIFRNLAGQFDESLMRQFLQQQNMTEPQMRAEISRGLYRQQLIGAIGLSGRMPEAIAHAYADLLMERRQGTIAEVPFQLAASNINPSEAEVEAYYRAHLAAFRTPERRVIKYAVIGPEQVANTPHATDAEIAAVYRNSPRSYAARETRTLQSIALLTRQAADAFAQRVRSGTNFVEAAAQAGFAAADVTFADKSRDQFATVTDPQVAQAAYAAAQGTVVGPIQSQGRFYVVRVDRVTSIAARPLESVRGDIAAFIDQHKRTDALAALVAEVDQQLASGASFEEAVHAHNLTVVTTPPVTATGQAVGEAYTAPPELTALLHGAFDIDPDHPDPAVAPIVENQRYAVVGLDRVLPAAPPPLAQIHDQVRTALINGRAAQAARQIADRVVQRINSGTPAAQALAEAQPHLPAGQHIDMQRMQLNQRGQQPPEPLLVLFRLPRGHAEVVASPSGDRWFIVSLENQIPGTAPNAQAVQSIRAELASGLDEEMSEQVERAARGRAEVTLNNEAIAQARAQIGGAAPPAAAQ